MSERMPEIPSDVLAGARRAEDAALERLVTAVYPTVRRWALIRTGDPSEADDLTQEVMIRMIRSLDSYQGDAAFTTWLYAVTRNAATDRVRRLRRRRRAHEDPRVRLELESRHRIDPPKHMEHMDMRAIIATFFEELPERQREVFDLVELQGLPATRVAELLGIEAVSVRAHLFKARRRMRARILERHPEVAEDLR